MTFYPKRDPKPISTDSYKKVELISFLKLNADKRNPNRINKCIHLLDIFWKWDWKIFEGLNKKKKIALYRGVWNDNIIFSSGFVYSYQYHDKDGGVNKIICENTHQ